MSDTSVPGRAMVLNINIRSLGANNATTACIFALKRFTGSESDGSPFPSIVPSSSTKWPPDEDPHAPIRSDAMP